MHMAKAAWLKLKKWYTQTDTEVLGIAAVLDPRTKLEFFRKTLHWSSNWVKMVDEQV